MRFEPSLFGPLDRALEEAYRDGALGVIAALPVIRDPNDGGRVVIGFNGRHPRAEQWSRNVAGGLIVDIVNGQRDAARDAIREGLEAGRSPRATALDIVGRINRQTGAREGGSIGLAPSQREWIEAARRQLEAGDYTAYRGRALRQVKLDGLIAKAEAAGRLLTPAEIDRMLGAYRNNVLRYRGEMIARTETYHGAACGQVRGISAACR